MNWLAVYFKIARACRTPFVFCLDSKYRPWDLYELKRASGSFPKWEYSEEYADCDDAAFAFKGHMGHSIGIAIGHGHAWNVALCNNGIWHIEPQTGEFSQGKRAKVIII